MNLYFSSNPDEETCVLFNLIAFNYFEALMAFCTICGCGCNKCVASATVLLMSLVDNKVHWDPTIPRKIKHKEILKLKKNTHKFKEKFNNLLCLVQDCVDLRK